MHGRTDAANRPGHVNTGFSYDKVCHHVRGESRLPALGKTLSWLASPLWPSMPQAYRRPPVKSTTYRIGIVGATGAVGQELANLLVARRFPASEVRLLASARSAWRSIAWGDRMLPVQEATPGASEGLNLAFYAVDGDIARRLAPEAAWRGCTVFDKSSAFRMREEEPLVVPEINLAAARHAYPTPLDFSRREKCGVGRLRLDTAFDNGFSLWVSSDNLWKGAALNSIQTAEVLIREGGLAPSAASA